MNLQRIKNFLKQYKGFVLMGWPFALLLIVGLITDIVITLWVIGILEAMTSFVVGLMMLIMKYDV